MKRYVGSIVSVVCGPMFSAYMQDIVKYRAELALPDTTGVRMAQLEVAMLQCEHGIQGCKQLLSKEENRLAAALAQLGKNVYG